MREKMSEFINKLKRIININERNKKDINQIVEQNGFEILDIYDVENVKGLIDSMKLNNMTPTFLYESIDFELDNPGGVIVFSIDLNSTLSISQNFIDEVNFFFDKIWKTFLERLNVNDKLKKILLSKYGLPRYTIGRNFKGSYTGKNEIFFNEKSFTIYIVGIDSDGLVLMATEICREFKQETVMVRDFNNDNRPKVYFVKEKNRVKYTDGPQKEKT